MGKPFIGEFTCKADVLRGFNAPKDALDKAKIHLAWYGTGSYCGAAMVVYEKYGTLWEVNASHCSCHGLEGQWEPERTSWEALQLRQLGGSYDDAGEAEALLHSLCEAKIKKPKTIKKATKKSHGKEKVL